MKKVGKYILNQLENKQISEKEAVTYLKEIQEGNQESSDDIAIIGMACRVPEADTPDEFWDNLVNGRNCFSTKPVEKLLLDDAYRNAYFAEFVEREQTTKATENLENQIGPFIKDIDKFDAGFFGIPPREAKYTDPQHRIFLEVAWSAIEDAGYGLDQIKDSNTGVYVGRDGTNNIYYKYITEPDSIKVTGTWEGILASRLNYLFNLTGPAMVIDTACSSGLVAMHEACNALKNGDCDMAIAGGVAILASTVETNTNPTGDEVKVEDEGSATIKSVDNRIRSFDKKASGTVFGEGVLALMLKPLKKAKKDHDNIYAIIKGSAINCDGTSNGIAAPNPAAQEQVIIDAWKHAKVEPESISYIETHGTGTLLGDPVEILGITNAFSRYTNKKQFCGIGSVKTNIGHLIGASGCANVMKVALALKNQMIPKSLYFEEPNGHINFIDSPVYVVDKLTEWKCDENPRRAGISSFGFSGTNCHMILEEAQAVDKRTTNVNSVQVVSFSAKTRTALENIFINYDKFLAGKNEINIEDLCYTANVGRGHYEYRVAFVIQSLEELKEKVRTIVENGWNGLEDKNIYFGRSKVVSDKRQHKAEGEISENEIRLVTISAQQIQKDLVEQGSFDDYEKTIELIKLYVKGAKINWAKFYENKDVYKISLPTYPFDKVHFWGDVKVTHLTEENSFANNDEKQHPLVEKCLVESMEQSIYLVNFNLEKQWVLQEHKIMGNNLVSGTTLVEVCMEALRQHFNSDKIVIDNLVFLTPLIVKLEEADVETHIIIKKENKNVSFVVVSKHYNNEDKVVWTENAKGNASLHTDNEVQMPTFESVKQSGNIVEEIVQSLEGNENDPTYFGPRWHCVKALLKAVEDDKDVIYTEIELPQQYVGDLKDGYRYHPGMLDDALNIGLQLYTGDDMFLPFSYKNMKIYRDLPRHFYSRLVRCTDESNEELVGGTFSLVDMDGNLLATIDECNMKKVTNFNDFVSDSFFGVRWYQKEVTDFTPITPNGNILIFEDKAGLSDELTKTIKSMDNQLYYVTFGKEFKIVDTNHYVIGKHEEDYMKLLEAIGTSTFSTVYHMSTVNFAKTDFEYSEYNDEVNEGLFSLFYLVRAFTQKITGAVDFVLVTENAVNVTGNEEYIKAANASFIALAKTTVGEFTSYSFRCVDIDSKTDKSKVIEEMLRVDEKELRIAYRENCRYTEEIAAYDLEGRNKESISVREQGIYVVSGGTSGLGLASAENIARYGKCNICLLGRRKMPERADWDKVMELGEDRKSCLFIETVRKIESMGSNVIVRYSEVTDYDNMSAIINELKDTYGGINGVIHSAGLPGVGFLFNKELDVFTNVTHTKIFGAIILDLLTRDQKLDFFIMYSSVQAILGGPGQGDYTAANAFLDSYAYYMRKKGIKAHSVNWPGWKETGMLIDLNLAGFVSVFRSITTDRGINALNNILEYNLTNIVPTEMEYDYLSRFKDGESIFPITLSKKIQANIRRYQARNGALESVEGKSSITLEELSIIGKSEDEYTETEKQVALAYATVFNLTEIDIYEKFGALGGDSIIATSVLKIINNKYNDMINISDMFTYGCVEEMAAFIDMKMAEN